MKSEKSEKNSEYILREVCNQPKKKSTRVLFLIFHENDDIVRSANSFLRVPTVNNIVHVATTTTTVEIYEI